MKTANRFQDRINSIHFVKRFKADMKAEGIRVFKEGEIPQCYFCHRFTTDMIEEMNDVCTTCDSKINSK